MLANPGGFIVALTGLGPIEPAGLTVFRQAQLKLAGHLLSLPYFHADQYLVPPQRCHPDRSEAQWRDLLCLSMPHKGRPM
jgi:hypothetical protein